MAENNLKYDQKENYESLDDIVFKYRNKEYGAYYLRKKYIKFVFIAFIISFFVVGSAVAYPVFEAWINRNTHSRNVEKTVVAEMQKINEEIPPPPPPPPPPPEVEAQTKFKAPVVVDTVKEEVKIATVDEAKEAAVQAPPEEIKVEEKKDEVVQEEEPVFYTVEENASFEGGDVNTFRKWVEQNIVYPTAASEAGISGKVIVQFIVNAKGKIADAKVVRGVHPSLDKEALRVIMSSPPWTPGKQGGRAVRQQFTIPIVFTLQ